MSIYNFEITDIKGNSYKLPRNKVLLIVNTASKCGFTPQFEQLEALYQKYNGALEVIGFPCNQFKQQDPASDGDIESFCQLNYGVTFPMMAKIDVNGANAHPLYKFLSAQATGVLGTKGIKWNFTKFLVTKDGGKVTRYAPLVKPENLSADIERLI